MDEQAILEAVASTYRKLRSFTAEVTSVQESSDEDSNSRQERRCRAWFSAPARIRIEQAGRTGNTVVSDGIDLHYYTGFRKHYYKRALTQTGPMPGTFLPAFPMSGGPPVLFSSIAETVGEAEILREEQIDTGGGPVQCQVIRVLYQSDERRGPFAVFSPVTFWLDTETHLVLRMDGDVTHRIPPDAEPRTAHHSERYRYLSIDEPIADERFQFTPPADAQELPMGGGGGGGGRGGTGSARRVGDPRGQWETWSSHEWDGEALVEKTQWKFRGVELKFERRMQTAEDGKEIRVTERITGPVGETSHEFLLPRPQILP